MNYFFTFVLIAQVILGVSLIVMVLLQHGKGADMGAAFGSGSSGSLLGASGSANVLSTITSWLAAGFFATSLALAFLASGNTGTSSVLKGSVLEDVQSAPATPGAAEVPAAPAQSGGAQSIPK